MRVGCQIIRLRDAERVGRQQVFSDGAEVRVVRAHHNGNAELRGLQRIVSARRSDAAADKATAASE